MNWKKVKDEFPPTDKPLMFCRNIYSTESSWEWYFGNVKRPYDRDKDYNPNYYYLSYYRFDENKWDKMALSNNDYWIEIKFPKEEE